MSDAMIVPPVDDNNGGTASWGRWQQTKEEVSAVIELPAGTRGRELQISFTSGAVSAVHKGTALLKGSLFAAVIADDCYWEIVDGQLEVHFVKEEPAKACGREDKTGWWPCVLTTDSALDVTLCDKEPFMLGEMDDLKHESMRSMVSRMLGSDDPTSGKAPTLDPLID